MKAYRIGNTIRIRWALMLADGAPLEIIPEKSELYLQIAQHKIKAEGYTVEGNLLTWYFTGSEQKYNGVYTLTFVMNRDDLEMVTVDCCDAFALVEWTCMAGGDEDTPGIVTSAIELYSTLPNRSFPVAVPSFDVMTSMKQKAVYVVDNSILVDKYPILRFRNMAPKLTDKYHVEIYRYVNRGRKRYQKRITIPLSDLDKWPEPTSGYGAVVLNVSLMRIFWEMWDAQEEFHNNQYDAAAIAESWMKWDALSNPDVINKFNGLYSHRDSTYKSEVLISGRFALRLYDTENNIGGEMRLLSIRLIEARFVPNSFGWNGKSYSSGRAFSLRVK